MAIAVKIINGGTYSTDDELKSFLSDFCGVSLSNYKVHSTHMVRCILCTNSNGKIVIIEQGNTINDNQQRLAFKNDGTPVDFEHRLKFSGGNSYSFDSETLLGSEIGIMNFFHFQLGYFNELYIVPASMSWSNTYKIDGEIYRMVIYFNQTIFYKYNVIT